MLNVCDSNNENALDYHKQAISPRQDKVEHHEDTKNIKWERSPGAGLRNQNNINIKQAREMFLSGIAKWYTMLQ